MPIPRSSGGDNLDSLDRELKNLKFALDQAAIVAVTDRAGVITYVNDKFCQISKYPREELIGKTHRIIKSGHHPSEFFDEMWKTIVAGKTWTGEVRNRAKGGSLYWVNTTIVPFLDSHGKPEQYVSIRYEITQRKRAESQLVLYASKLEQSNRELTDFASIAAHDLQEPLRKIQVFSDRVTKRIGNSVGPETVDYLARMGSAAQRMQQLIDDLLSYSRVTTGAQPFIAIDLNDVVADVLSDIEVQLEQVAGSVEYQGLPSLEADPVQMRQLFQNLISNALKFHKQDVPPQVVITSRVIGKTHPSCEISVQDNGIGFEEKYVDRIFTIFQRLHGRHEYEGTGVGLAVCRRIVDRHGGSLTAKSEPGKGATFIVTIPLKAPKKEEEI